MKLDKITFATLISFIQVLVTEKQLERSDIECIDAMISIDAEPQPVDIILVNKLLFEIRHPDGFINAIKAYRALTGAGLKESKDAIEKYRYVKPVFNDQDELYKVLRDGIATLVDAALWIKQLHKA